MDVKTWLAIPGAIAVLAGGLCAANSYVAKDVELQKVAGRLDEKIRSDQIYSVQQQIWQMDDRYRGIPEYEWAPHDLDRYRRLKLELQTLIRGN